jgi:hypothetical protein
MKSEISGHTDRRSDRAIVRLNAGRVERSTAENVEQNLGDLERNTEAGLAENIARRVAEKMTLAVKARNTSVALIRKRRTIR